MAYSLPDKLSSLAGHYQRPVLKNLELLLSVILVSRTVNLNKLKDDLPSVLDKPSLKAGSCYKKLLRCVDILSPSRLWLDLLQWALSFVWGVTNHLTIDATEWLFGKYPIHILVLSVDFQGVAVPIYFSIYKHKGVLCEQARIRFMKKALRCYNLKGRDLLADREFIGDQWFSFLDDQDINFIIRLRKKQYQAVVNQTDKDKDKDANTTYSKLIAKALKKGYAQTLITISKKTFRLEFWRNKHQEESKKEPVIFLLTNNLAKKRVGKQYTKRWRIEYCFKHLKSNGFNIEAIGFKKIHKVQFLIAMVVVVYILSICEGMAIDKQNNTKSKWKKYKSGLVSRAMSIFRQGLFALKANCYTLEKNRQWLAKLKVPKNSFSQFVQ